MEFCLWIEDFIHYMYNFVSESSGKLKKLKEVKIYRFWNCPKEVCLYSFEGGFSQIKTEIVDELI